MSPPAPPHSLRRAAVRGMVWMVGQTTAIKFVNFAGQFVLAWFLTKADFGVVGMAATVVALASVLTQTGVRQVLVRRQAHFDRWAQAAAGLSMALGTIGYAIVIVAGILAAKVYGEPKVLPVILLLGLSIPINALASAPAARLQVDLKFRAIAWINLFTTLVLTGTAALLAWRHFGPFSIAAGQIASDAFRTIAQWLASGIGRPRRLHVRRWKYLFGDSWWLIGASALSVVVLQGDYFVLGLAQAPEIVGVYYFAYNLSTQALQLVTINLAGVLLPVLSKFQPGEPLQIRRFLDATETMAYFGVPICLLQVLLARPLLELVYAHKWDASILPLQLLSLAMVPAVIGGHSGVLMQAQGRFRSNFYFCGASAAVFLACVAVAARSGPAAVAIGVIVAYTIIAIGGLLWACSPTAEVCRRVIAIFVQPTSLGLAAAAIVYWAAKALADRTSSGAWAYVPVVLAGYPVLYAAAVRGLRPGAWRAIVHRLRGTPDEPAAADALAS